MSQTITFKKLPDVLSFKRGHVLSDALMFNQMPNGDETPVEVIRHGVRGTQNIPGKDSKDVSVSNVQTIETAKLDIAADAMIIRFDLAFLPLCDSLNGSVGTSKNREESKDMRLSIENFLERAEKSEGLQEVARRYARNIANGRWLWRNRTIAYAIRIEVTIGNRGSAKTLIASFDALEIPLNNFDNYVPDEIKLGEEIASQMRQDGSRSSLTIEATIVLRVPGSEVFPSQNYIQKKPIGFARSLYKIGHPEPLNKKDMKENIQNFKDIRVMGQAALRDQKVFNAIRTIDTWYRSFAEDGFPISVEPRGASLKTQEFYRNEKGANSFDLFKRLNLIEPNEKDGMFCIASFDRGGVYSEGDKAEKVERNKQEGEE